MPAVELRDPTETTAPVADTTAGLWTFSPAATHFQFQNYSGQICYLRFNSASAATATTYDVAVATNQRIGAAIADTFLVQTVSIWFPAAATVASVSLRGI